MFFLFKLFCAVIFPPSALLFISEENRTPSMAVVLIGGTILGWAPGSFFAALYLILDKAILDKAQNEDNENSEQASTENQQLPQQSTDAVQNKVEDQLSKLKQMLEQGIITEEEYTKLRSKIIDTI